MESKKLDPDTLGPTIIGPLRENLSKVIRGKDNVLEYILVALFSSGNILLEDVPGVGKTTLAKTLAKSISGKFNRIQFTPDLLPIDILGGSIYNPKTGDFSFKSGPIFANIILADEINRASPRTQSSLLEVMTENQVTVEGTSRRLDPPFVVIATQNPSEFHGTYPLPESQLDRFLVRLELGYPSAQDEFQILSSQRVIHPLDGIRSVTDCNSIVKIQHKVREIDVEESVVKYMISIVRQTRETPELRLGASPRASLMLFRASQALALLREREYVIPDDVRELAVPVLAHRISLNAKGKYSTQQGEIIIKEIVESLPVPL